VHLPQPVIRFVSAREAELVQPWEIETRVGRLIVYPGVRTDGASIPRLLDGLEGYHHFDGETFPACFAHDQLYAGELCPRAQADLVLYDLLVENGVSALRAGTYLNAVKIGGGATWKAHTPATIAATRALVLLYPRN